MRFHNVGILKVGLTDSVSQRMMISSSSISTASSGVNGAWLEYASLKDRVTFCSKPNSTSGYHEGYGMSTCIYRIGGVLAGRMASVRGVKEREKEILQEKLSHVQEERLGGVATIIESECNGCRITLRNGRYYEINSYGFNTDDTFLTRPSLYTAYYGLSVPVISFYFQKFEGLELGFSYFPAFGNGGADIYDGIISGGVKYQGNYSGVNYSLSGVAEYADASNGLEVTNNKYNDIIAYSTGVQLNYKNITFVGSYGNLGKSGIKKFTVYPYIVNSPQVQEIVDSEFYDLGVKFTNSSYNIGLTLFHSSKDVVIEGIDYKTYRNKHSLSVCTLGLEKVLSSGVSFLR
ncbi:MAG: hypothetical protein ACTJLM_05575 [Ehrlichia sp.]